MVSIYILTGILLSGHQVSRNFSGFRPNRIGSGIIVEQVYINDDYAQKSWRLDGTPIKKWIATAEMRSGSSHSMPNRWNLYVRFRHSEFIHHPSVVLRTIQGKILVAHGQTAVFDLKKEGEEFATFPIEKTREETTEFQIGIEGGMWHDLTVYEKRNRHFEFVKGSPFDLVVNDPAGFYRATDPEDIGLTIPLPFSGRLRAYRVAFKHKKETWTPYGGFFGASSQYSDFNQSNWHRGPFAIGDKIALQTRGYMWTTIKGAVLWPRNTYAD